MLVLDGEQLTENLALQFWISLMAWFASTVHPHLTPNVRPERYCDVPGSEESVKRLTNKLLFEDFAIADRMLDSREWFFSHFTAVDAYFFWCFRRATTFKLDVSGFRHCYAHFERVQRRPSVQKVLAYEQQVLAEFAKGA